MRRVKVVLALGAEYFWIFMPCHDSGMAVTGPVVVHLSSSVRGQKRFKLCAVAEVHTGDADGNYGRLVAGLDIDFGFLLAFWRQLSCGHKSG